MLVSRSVRRSIRPCPLSTRLATCPGGGGGTWPVGGKSRGTAPRLLLEGQPGLDVGDQAGLIILGEQDVVPALVDDLGAQVALAEHGVAGDDTAGQRQHAQQLQGRLVFVGLGIDPQLRQHRLTMGGVGGHQVLPGYLIVLAAAGGLAVQAHQEFLAFGQAGADPACQGVFQSRDVQGTEDFAEGGRGRGLAAAKAQGPGQGRALVAAVLGDGGVALTAGEHGQHGQGEQGGQGVASPVARAGVGELGEDIQ